jgi:hypothetical protein
MQGRPCYFVRSILGIGSGNVELGQELGAYARLVNQQIRKGFRQLDVGQRCFLKGLMRGCQSLDPAVNPTAIQKSCLHFPLGFRRLAPVASAIFVTDQAFRPHYLKLESEGKNLSTPQRKRKKKMAKVQVQRGQFKMAKLFFGTKRRKTKTAKVQVSFPYNVATPWPSQSHCCGALHYCCGAGTRIISAWTRDDFGTTI